MKVSERVQPAQPGEICPCGKPAVAVLTTVLGRLPTCIAVEDLRQQVERSVGWASGRDHAR